MIKTAKKSPTEHVTFRISKKILQELKEISADEKISLNTLTNQILNSHLKWDLHAPEVGWVVMLKSAVTELIKKADDQTIIKIAKESAETGAKEIALYMRGNYGIEEWLSILKDRAKMSGFNLKEYSDKNGKKIVMHHEMGEKWSLFFKTYYETVFYDLGVKVRTEITENSIILFLENLD